MITRISAQGTALGKVSTCITPRWSPAHVVRWSRLGDQCPVRLVILSYISPCIITYDLLVSAFVQDGFVSLWCLICETILHVVGFNLFRTVLEVGLLIGEHC